jgi:hypothetical protein
MKTRLFIPPLLSVVFVAFGIETYLAQDQNAQDQIEPARKPTSQIRNREPEKETQIQNAVANLLSTVGVRVGDTVLRSDARTYRQVTIRWQSSATPAMKSADLIEKQAGSGTLKLLASLKRNGSLPRERSFELASTQLLIIALDKREELRWWRLLPDPRLIRSESPTTTGEISGETFYLPETDFIIEYPDDPEIVELRFYHPAWTGKEFRLETISTLSVD